MPFAQALLLRHVPNYGTRLRSRVTGLIIMNKQIRVITGIAKNKRLKAPEIKGFRAVQGVAKASLFSILGEQIEGTICLDLFSGSGGLGIEALSRGAKRCTFVDEESRAIQTIEENLRNCDLVEKAEIVRKNAVKFTGDAPRNYDVIFLDPFYDDTSHKFLMQNLENILEEDGIIVFFHGKNLDLDKTLENTDLKVIDHRRFGKSYFSLIKNK